MSTRAPAVQMLCPNLRCRKFLSAPEEMRGRMVRCNHCQTTFRVPETPQKKAPPAHVRPGR